MIILDNLWIILAQAISRAEPKICWIIYIISYLLHSLYIGCIGFICPSLWTVEHFLVCCEKCILKVNSEILLHIHNMVLKAQFRLWEATELLVKNMDSNFDSSTLIRWAFGGLSDYWSACNSISDKMGNPLFDEEELSWCKKMNSDFHIRILTFLDNFGYQLP